VSVGSFFVYYVLRQADNQIAFSVLRIELKSNHYRRERRRSPLW